jgi:hypothetical protein
MEHAKYLLYDKGLSVTEVSAKCWDILPSRILVPLLRNILALSLVSFYCIDYHFPLLVIRFPLFIIRYQHKIDALCNKSFMKFYILLFALCSHLSALTQDRYFTRTYTSNVLPKGAIDLEIWHTTKMGHSNQYYNAQEQRIELEFGLGKKWQTAFYFNRYQKIASE